MHFPLGPFIRPFVASFALHSPPFPLSPLKMPAAQSAKASAHLAAAAERKRSSEPSGGMQRSRRSSFRDFRVAEEPDEGGEASPVFSAEAAAAAGDAATKVGACIGRCLPADLFLRFLHSRGA